jgi:hypothetical protein
MHATRISRCMTYVAFGIIRGLGKYYPRIRRSTCTSGANRTSNSELTGVFPGVKAAGACCWPPPWLRMSGAMPLLSLYAFVVWTGKTWPFKWLPGYFTFYKKPLHNLLVSEFCHRTLRFLKETPSFQSSFRHVFDGRTLNAITGWSAVSCSWFVLYHLF